MIFETITSYLFLKSIAFWIIISVGLFSFITFIYYKNCEKRNKPLNMLIILLLFFTIIPLGVSTWYFTYGNKPTTVNKAKTTLTSVKDKWKERRDQKKKEREGQPSLRDKLKRKPGSKNVDHTPELVGKIDDTLKEMADIRKGYQNEADKLEPKLKELESKLKEQTETTELLGAQKQEIEKALEDNKKAIHEATLKLEEAERKKLTFENQLKVLNGQITLKEAQLQEENERMAGLVELEKTASSKDKTKIQAQIKELKENKIPKLEKELEELIQQKTDLLVEIRENDDNIKILEKYIADLEKNQKEYMDSMTKVNQEFEDSTVLKDFYASQVNALKTELNQVNTTLQELQKKEDAINKIKLLVNSCPRPGQQKPLFQIDPINPNKIAEGITDNINLGKQTKGFIGGLIDGFVHTGFRWKDEQAKRDQADDARKEAKRRQKAATAAKEEQSNSIVSDLKGVLNGLYGPDDRLREMSEDEAQSIKKYLDDFVESERTKLKKHRSSLGQDVIETVEASKQEKRDRKEGVKEYKDKLTEHNKSFMETVKNLSTDLQKYYQKQVNFDHNKIDEKNIQILEKKIEIQDTKKQIAKLENRDISANKHEENIQNLQKEAKQEVNKQLTSNPNANKDEHRNI